MISWKDHHLIYGVWNEMKNRCNNPKRHNWYRYGGRGISYSVAWEEFKNFAGDMLPTWFANAKLDRIDNNGHYCKENCHWVTATESSRNRPSNKLTLEMAEEIRRLYKVSRITQRRLAERFNTSLANINYTIHHKQWKV